MKKTSAAAAVIHTTSMLFIISSIACALAEVLTPHKSKEKTIECLTLTGNSFTYVAVIDVLRLLMCAMKRIE